MRQLYQRPGVLENYAGLNARLRSMSVRKSSEENLDSAANQYQMKQKGAVARPGYFPPKLGNGRADLQNLLIKEMEENEKKVESFMPQDPYTQQMPVYLCKSPFTGRPPTVFFQYPPGVNEKKKKVDKEHIFKMK